MRNGVKILLEILLFFLSVEKPVIVKTNPGYSEEKIKDELCVGWLAHLQHKQTSETHVLENAVVDKVRKYKFQKHDLTSYYGQHF